MFTQGLVRKQVTTYRSLLVVDHDIVRLDIPMHNTLRMTEIQCLEKLEHIKTDVEICEFGI